MKQLQRIFRRGIAATLCCAMLLQSTCVYAAGDENSVSHTADTSAPSVKTYENNGTEVEVSDDSTDFSINKNDNAADNGAAGGADNSTSDSMPADFSAVYANGRIRIWNAAQLAAIGSGEAVTSTDNTDGRLGQGTPVTDADGTQIIYSPDAQYQLMNDIPLTAGSIWNLPAGFTGSFTSSDGSAVTKDAPLYDSATDTIYVYNSYQLDVIRSENAAEEPVMSNDMIAEEFGMGQLVYPDGAPAEGDEAAAQGYLTYGPGHKYVLVQEFTAERPELKAEAVVQADGDAEGRDFKGQVIYTDPTDGKEYILIGNEQQLRAIGSGSPVKTAAYKVEYIAFKGWELYLENGEPVMLYSGDADLDKEQNGSKDYKLGEEDDKGWHIGDGDLDYCGVHQKAEDGHSAGEIDPDFSHDETGHSYTTDENYIIFRNITLDTSNPWTPIMFTGTMQGRLSMDASAPVTISGVRVTQSGSMDIEEQMGIGFFATISNKSSQDAADIGKSKGRAEVKNITLSDVEIHNQSTQVQEITGLVNAVLTGLASLLGFSFDIPILGDILKFLVGALGIPNIDEVLTTILTNNNNDPTVMATGGFVGRITGDVLIENCKVTNLQVDNARVNAGTGGFAGSIAGMAYYDDLSDVLGNLVNVLVSILNILPFLDIGTVIDILLGQEGLVNVANLIPAGYYSPRIKNCSVENFKTKTIGKEHTEGSDGSSYVGGFVGKATGATIEGCHVGSDTEALTVYGKDFVGGFAGVLRNGEVSGALNDLNIDLIKPVALQTMVLKSEVRSQLAVHAGNKYAGGFAGAMANSYAVNSSVKKLQMVKASGDFAGGFAGYASLGWATALGKEYTEDAMPEGLLGVVGGLLSNALSGDQAAMVLSLAGVCPSALAGVSVTGVGESSVEGKNYVGGLFGKGTGTQVMKSSAENLAGLTAWNWREKDDAGEAAGCSVTGLKSITANENYGGGVAGYAENASAAGILGATVGVVSYLPFKIEDTVVGSQTAAYSVSAKNYAGGVIGQGVGGTASRVQVTNLSGITAENNYGGGFAGSIGAASVADVEGLNILGLNLVTAGGLLGVADCIRTVITDVSVTGSGDGFTVEVTGSNEVGETEQYAAGGFVGYGGSIEAAGCTVSGLKKVTADEADGMAGGFAGLTDTGKLLSVANETEVPGIASIGNLLSAVSYLLPKFYECSVEFSQPDETDPVQVSAYMAGGFAGSLQSAQINQEDEDSGAATTSTEGYDGYAVKGLKRIEATGYAGGFAGNIEAGGLASVGDGGGLSLLSGLLNGALDVRITNLLSVFNTYIPHIDRASVKSLDDEPSNDVGFSVEATDPEKSYAGGYVGYARGTVITNSSVETLRHTTVAAPDDLETDNSEESASYFNREQSDYAVAAGDSAGGFAGTLDIGNVAAVGEGIGILGELTGLDSLLGVLDVAASKITNCHVNGAAGGFSVISSGKTEKGDPVGHAGGYVGHMCGAQVNGSNVHNFEYIIGQEAAGGYAGTLEPGNVADVIEDIQVLGGLIEMDNFLSAVQSFVPYIRNSSTDTVPCGGAVRAESGSAGGYAGHSLGGQILGYADAAYGTPSEAAAYRIRSVYGLDYAGGFTGLMETASVADTGSLSILGGLVNLDNPLTVAQGVYPIEENTAVYGPLSHVELDTWNKWVQSVGSNGPFGNVFTEKDTFTDQAELDHFLEQYVYGYCVASPGRDAGAGARENGSAGGYVGKMLGGVITNGNAHDLQKVTAWRGAGGYAGEMQPGSAASVGGLELGDLTILNTSSVNLLETFVPAIKTSDVEGYSSGYTVTAAGTNTTDKKYDVGYAGGYVGHMTGGQIWGAENETDGTVNHCSATGVRRVTGTASVGGFAGMTEPGTTLTADTKTESGLLNQILGLLLDSEELLDILPAMVATIRYADVSAWDDYGYTVSGAYNDGSDNTRYADSAGGFVGRATGTVFGEQVLDEDGKVVINEQAGVSANGVRNVTGGRNAGGFIGKSSAAGVAEVADSDESDESTTLLDKVLGLKGIEILDIFRTYVYASHVSGSADSGLEVTANEGSQISDKNDALVYDGNAGGFAGSLLSGDTHQCTVTGLRAVKGINFTGGFTGYMGKTGLVDASGVDVLDKLLGLGVGVADVIGCQAEDCTVTGFGTEKADQEEEGVKVDSASAGFTVTSSNAAETKAEIAGGFVGYANLGRMTNDHVYGLKQVSSGETAGGFVGRTSHAYLAEVTLDGVLVQLLADVLNVVLDKILGVDNIEEIGLIKIDLGIIKLDALCESNLVSLTLLGLPITIALEKDQDTLLVTIGDSTIKWGYTVDEDGHATVDEKSEIKVNLIKANRSKADGCSVVGVPDGYDVYGGGAGNGSGELNKGTGDNGFAGGFVGYNDEGLLENNTMLFADVIRGTKDRVGPFSGRSSNKSVFPNLDGVEEVEQDGNTYRIYRVADPTYTQIIPSTGTGVKNSGHQSLTSGDHNWEIYTIDHMTDSGVKYFTELNGAKLHSTESGKADIALQAYMDEGAKAVLMLDSPTETTPPSDTPEPPEQQDPCETTIRLTVNKIWKDGGDTDRRKEITLTIWQEKKGVPNSKVQYGETITLTSADEVKDNIWQKVIKDLPVYELQADGTKVYYIYTVTEAELGDYETKIEYSDDGYTVTITNSLPWHELLPDAGGMGTRLLYLAGVLLVLAAALSYFRSRSRMAEAAAGNGRPGSPGGRRRVRRRQRIHDRHSRR